MKVKNRIPDGWVRTGAKESNYLVGLTEEESHSDSQCAYIESKRFATGAFGTLAQGIKANQYRGKKLVLKAWVKAVDITGWAGLWMRIDGDKSVHKKPLQFDNMHDRPITGTNDWQQFEVKLPVANEASAVVFGVMLCGEGRVLFDDFELIPDGSIEGEPASQLDFELDSYINDCPVNLNFQN